MADDPRDSALLRDMGRFHRRDHAKPLDLDRAGTSAAETWFLGPKAENADLLRGLIEQALGQHVRFRREYMPGDPEMFDTKHPPADFHPSADRLRERLDDMLYWLHGSIPLASYRNQSHMYWDVTLPGLAGYIAALFYNQNNVAAEASPVTTLLEVKVGDDLCRMIGFPLPSDQEIARGAIRPWGHITCDGSVANSESMWASRNLKYQPVAVAEAIRAAPELGAARNLTVTTTDGKRRRLLDLDAWELMNLPLDEAIGLTPRITKVAGIDADTITAVMGHYAVQAVGLVEFHRAYLDDVNPPVVLAPATAHYSWPKSAALIGLGKSALKLVPVDLDGRMDMVALRRVLDECLAKRQPVQQVVAVIGTTEESAVDPLHEILEIREEYRALGMEFAVHADAAWGGYFASMLRAPQPETKVNAKELAREVGVPYFADDRTEQEVPPGLFTKDGRSIGFNLSGHVLHAYEALGEVDTLTVDPHKAGFIPYPAGALCYRNGAMRDLIAFTAPVVFHGGVDPAVGYYGIEGSKPGAAAAAVWLSHAVIRTDQSGYGRLLGRCIFNSKRLYAALFALERPGDCFTVTPFQRLPAERAGCLPSEVAAQAEILAKRVAPFSNEELLTVFRKHPEIFELFRESGSDQSIIAYSFNFRTGDGPNTDQALLNDYNQRIFEKLSIQAFNGGEVPTARMFVTSSSFAPDGYGQDFVSAYARRTGVEPVEGMEMKFLISTTQNPWLTSTAQGDMLPEIMAALRDAANRSAEEMIAAHGLTPPVAD